jgi:hypothetical protein
MVSLLNTNGIIMLIFGQLLLDEFFLGISKKDNSWKNKYGYQLGLNTIMLWNKFVGCLSTTMCGLMYILIVNITNYGHNNQNIGHRW